MNSNRDFVEPPKHGFFCRYGWYIIPIGILLWGYGPQIKGFLLDGLNKLIIMNTPAHPEDDDSFVPDDSVFEADTYGEPQKNAARRSVAPNEQNIDEFDSDEPTSNIEVNEVTTSNDERGLSTSELMDRKIHQNIVKQAQRAGVSAEGTDEEIMDRITHQSIVKQAKRAGVSAEGTDEEIMDRITHQSIVKQAKRAGVSTEGTDEEIMDRITHQSIVKQAKRAGVSTEGTDEEIMDRILRKNLEKYN